MKVMVTGAKGQLGYDVIEELRLRGHDVVGVDVDQMDITDRSQVTSVMEQVKPDAVIHCAAWTAVDAAEDEKNRELVYKVNVSGTDHIAEMCKKLHCKLLYLSTDYVFDGQGDKPWRPDCKSYSPLNVYGKTKLEGELSIARTLERYFIVRIAWVFGRNGNNFVKTMLKLSQTHHTLKVVSDQIGTPTYTYDLAKLLADMIESDRYGYYHATNEGGFISWAEFAKEIFRLSRRDVQIIPVTTEEYGLSIAKRPLNSRLDKTKLVEKGFKPLPDWQDALKRFVKEIEL